MVECIISGGQTGADQAGLFAAKELGINTGGYAPKGWRTEAGPALWLMEYELDEWNTEDYSARTKRNVMAANATVIFGKRSKGSNLTEEYCRQLDKPCRWVYYGVKDMPIQWGPKSIKLWLTRLNVKILNVAGNRESKNPGIGEFTKKFLLETLK